MTVKVLFYKQKKMYKAINYFGEYPAGNYMFKVNNRNTRTRC